ncbi:MAG: hypothetical protein Q9216_004389 [Gyalolechia sp. 2 TL-2023]
MAASGDETTHTISPTNKQPVPSSKLEEIATKAGILLLVPPSSHRTDAELGMRFGSPICCRIRAPEDPVVEQQHHCESYLPLHDASESQLISQNDTLKSLISESSTPIQPPLYKFAVTSTIIQHVNPPPSQTSPGNDPGTNGTTQEARSVGRRGMHSASGAYWNNEKDGMWHWKYTKGEEKGFDVVLSIIWISID